ncbi:hypothetical protein AHF37_01765 [Paragonimus kellicotti]|nr:hypothetical protein AHF37_01765 [Paragonimus kellicotti]
MQTRTQPSKHLTFILRAAVRPAHQSDKITSTGDSGYFLFFPNIIQAELAKLSEMNIHAFGMKTGGFLLVVETAIDRHQENQYTLAYKTQHQRHQSLRKNALDRLRAFRFGSSSNTGRHLETSDTDYNPDEPNTTPISSVHKTQKSLSQPNEPRNSVLSPADLVRIEKVERKRRMRTKATKLVVMVTTLWCVCWLPTHVINSWFFFDEKTFPFTATMKKIKLITQTLSFVASCVNPVVYGIMTGTFKNAITNRLFRGTRQPATTTPVINGAGVTEVPSILITQASTRDSS